jgi:hypothetical protein
MTAIALRRLAAVAALAALCAAGGCGASKQRLATEQLLLSDAVDRAVARIDFTSLAGRRVFFDTQYLQAVNGLGFVNAPYVISSLRQQMNAAGCLLQDKITDADVVVEARVGTLGSDAHEVTYGIPANANSGLASAAALVPNTPRMPALPDLALARRNDLRGAAKIAVFAYHRESRLPVWQSGLGVATSTARDSWILGSVPIQSGTVYEQVRQPGHYFFPREQTRIETPPNLVSYYDPMDFTRLVGRPDPYTQRPPKRDGSAAEPLVAMPQLSPLSMEATAPPAGPRPAPPGRPPTLGPDSLHALPQVSEGPPGALRRF